MYIFDVTGRVDRSKGTQGSDVGIERLGASIDHRSRCLNVFDFYGLEGRRSWSLQSLGRDVSKVSRIFTIK